MKKTNRKADQFIAESTTEKGDHILMRELVRHFGTMVDGKGCFAGIPEVREAAKEVGIEDFDATLKEMWTLGTIVPHWGNPGKYEDKSALYHHDGDVYCCVSEY